MKRQNVNSRPTNTRYEMKRQVRAKKRLTLIRFDPSSKLVMLTSVLKFSISVILLLTKYRSVNLTRWSTFLIWRTPLKLKSNDLTRCGICPRGIIIEQCYCATLLFTVVLVQLYLSVILRCTYVSSVRFSRPSILLNRLSYKSNSLSVVSPSSPRIFGIKFCLNDNVYFQM